MVDFVMANVNIIQRILFPASADTSELYIRCKTNPSISRQSGRKYISLTQNETISLNTYFNSFYESYYAKHTDLRSAYYMLDLEGNFKVLVYRDSQNKARELISTQEFSRCRKSHHAKCPLPRLDTNKTQYCGRIYLKIVCLGNTGLFAGGYIATDQVRCREVSLGIITCTFRREKYIEKTIETIVNDTLLKGKHLEIFVIDNGNTLTEADFQDGRVRLIPNRNVGGSGGFSRGLIEALREGTYTHFLLMDDDIELESESIYRLFVLYEYANENFAVSGSMLDLHKRTVLHEAGAVYAVTPEHRHNPFAITSLKNKLSLEGANALNLLLAEEHIDYGAFWFFSFPKDIIQRIGLTMPIFITGDDMDFGLRINKYFGNIIIAFPAIAVWHEPFYAKVPLWYDYYAIRNHLIINSMHGISTYLKTIETATHRFLSALFLFHYDRAQTCITAFEDYLQGQALITQNTPELLHAAVTARAKKHGSRVKVSSRHLPMKQFHGVSKIRGFRKLIRLLTVNGHLLPNFLFKNDKTDILDLPLEWPRIFRRKTFIFRHYTGIFQSTMNRTTGIRLLLTWLKIVVKIGMKWSFVKAEWRNASKYLTSVKFWEEYLGLTKE